MVGNSLADKVYNLAVGAWLDLAQKIFGYARLDWDVVCAGNDPKLHDIRDRIAGWMLLRKFFSGDKNENRYYY